MLRSTAPSSITPRRSRCRWSAPRATAIPGQDQAGQHALPSRSGLCGPEHGGGFHSRGPQERRFHGRDHGPRRPGQREPHRLGVRQCQPGPGRPAIGRQPHRAGDRPVRLVPGREFQQRAALQCRFLRQQPDGSAVRRDDAVRHVLRQRHPVRGAVSAVNAAIGELQRGQAASREVPERGDPGAGDRLRVRRELLLLPGSAAPISPRPPSPPPTSPTR